MRPVYEDPLESGAAASPRKTWRMFQNCLTWPSATGTMTSLMPISSFSVANMPGWLKTAPARASTTWRSVRIYLMSRTFESLIECSFYCHALHSRQAYACIDTDLRVLVIIAYIVELGLLFYLLATTAGQSIEPSRSLLRPLDAVAHRLRSEFKMIHYLPSFD